MKITSFSTRTLAYIRVYGPYGEGYEAACTALLQWLKQHGVVGSEWIFLYLDDPNRTAPKDCRTDIAVTVPVGTQGIGEVAIQSLVAGRYACLRAQVNAPNQYRAYWQQLMAEVTAAGEQFGPQACFELYHHFDPATQVADVSFCAHLA